MAKAKSKIKHVRKIAVPQAESATLPPQGEVADIRKPVLIIVGGQRMADGSLKNIAKEDAAKWAAVNSEQLKSYAQGRKAVNVGLTMNLLAGTQLPQDVLTKGAECWADRMLKDDKRAFFYIVENANAELCRLAWDNELKERKRFDRPTLQALSKAVRHYKALGDKGERRVSPFEKFARECLAVLDNKSLSMDERLREVRSLLEAKSGLDAEREERIEKQNKQKVA